MNHEKAMGFQHNPITEPKHWLDEFGSAIAVFVLLFLVEGVIRLVRKLFNI